MKKKKFKAIVRRHKSAFDKDGYTGTITNKNLKPFVNKKVEVEVKEEKERR